MKNSQGPYAKVLETSEDGQFDSAKTCIKPFYDVMSRDFAVCSPQFSHARLPSLLQFGDRLKLKTALA